MWVSRLKGIDKSSLEQGLAVGHLLHNERTVLYGQDSTGTLIHLGPITIYADETIVVEGVDVESKYYLAQSALNHCEPFCVALRREVKCPGVSSSPARTGGRALSMCLWWTKTAIL